MVDRVAAISRVMSRRQDVERGHIRGHRLRYRVLAPDARGVAHKFGLITFFLNPYTDTIVAYRSVFRQPMSSAMLALETDTAPVFFQSTDMSGVSGSTAAHFIAYSWAGSGKFCIKTRRNRDNLPAKGTLRAGHTITFSDSVLKGQEYKVETIDRANEIICLNGRIRRADWNKMTWEVPATYAGKETGPAQTGTVVYGTGKLAISGNVFTGPRDFNLHTGSAGGRFPAQLRIDTKNKKKIDIRAVEAGLDSWRLNANILSNGWARILADDGKMLWQQPFSKDVNTPYQLAYTAAQRTAIRAESKITVQIVTGVTTPAYTQFRGFSWAGAAPDPPDPDPVDADAKEMKIGLRLGQPVVDSIALPINIGWQLGRPVVDPVALPIGVGLSLGKPAGSEDLMPHAMGVGLHLGRPGQDGMPDTLKFGLQLGQPLIIPSAKAVGIGLQLGKPGQDGEITPRVLGAGLQLGKPGQDGEITPRLLSVGFALGRPEALGSEIRALYQATSNEIYDEQIADAIDVWIAEMHAAAGSGFEHPVLFSPPQPQQRLPF